MTERGNYFQPAALLHAACSVLWVFSHWVIDWVSLSLILPFMQVQYFVITSTAAFSSLLSVTHCETHFTSSGPAIAAPGRQRMKKGLTQICLGRKSLIRDGLQLCKEIGYHGLEILLTESGELTLNSGPEDYRAILKMSEEAGV